MQLVTQIFRTEQSVYGRGMEDWPIKFGFGRHRNEIHFIYFLVALLFACSSQHKIIENGAQTDELLDLAKANCFFWYFKKKGYELEDIRSISGGIVEMGSYSADRYRQIALMVKDYSPAIKTKKNIDIDLLKCFELDRDPDFIRSLGQLK